MTDKFPLSTHELRLRGCVASIDLMHFAELQPSVMVSDICTDMENQFLWL